MKHPAGCEKVMEVRIIEINDIRQAEKNIIKVGADKYSLPIMSPKGLNRSILVNNIDNRAANFLKQEMLSIGAEAAVSRDVGGFKKGQSKILLMGTLKHYGILCEKIKRQPFGLSELGQKVKNALLNYEENDFVINCRKNTKINLGKKTAVMGILNITPDSFSDQGRYFDSRLALIRAEEMVSQGADIIDVGGESSRPGAEPVSVKEEKNRILPVITELARKIKAPISVDTYKPEVAEAAIKAGASIINDITGLRYKNGSMAKVVSKHNVPVVIMHMQGMPRSMQKKPAYKNVIEDLLNFFQKQTEFARKSGIKDKNIILDPGIGFGKTLEHNIQILKSLKEFKVLGYPILLGASRKSFIGTILNNVPAKDRLAGSIAVASYAAGAGANILRVHDVQETVEAAKLIKYIKN